LKNIIILAFCIFFNYEVSAQEVLILNYFYRGNYHSDKIIEGIEKNYSSHQNITIEYLGLPREADEEYIHSVEEILKRKYPTDHFDYIVNINPSGVQCFDSLFGESKRIYTGNVDDHGGSVEILEHNIDDFIDNILHIQPFIKKLYLQEISWKRLIALKKKYFYVEFESINLDETVGVALLNLLDSSNGLLLTKEISTEAVLEKIKNLNTPVYAFNLPPKDYHSVVFQEDYYLKGKETIELLGRDILTRESKNIKLSDSIYLFNSRDFNRYRIFYKDIDERVEFFNRKDFFIVMDRSTVKNILGLFLISFSAFCIFFLIKWRALIRELRELKVVAERHSEIKGAFLANMTHEIRTPLNGIIGMTSILKEDSTSNPIKAKLKVVENNANHLLSVVNQILDFSKIEAEETTLSREDFEVNNLFSEIIDIFYPLAKQKNIGLYIYLHKDIPNNLMGDYLKIKQVLTNIIGNALKFTTLGEVVVRVRVNSISRDVCSLNFSIKDTGIGIAKEDMPNLFKSFTQIDGSYTRKHDGTGLGLSITKRLLDCMGSDLRLDSVRGIGSCFYFHLDLSIPKLSEYEYDENLEFLILEDSREALVHEVEMLEDYGLSYIITYNFSEFQELLTDLISDDSLRVLVSESQFTDNLKFFREFLRCDLERGVRIKVLMDTYKNIGIYEELGVCYSFKNPLFHRGLIEFNPQKVEVTEGRESIRINKKILVVEDNPVNAHVLINYLERLHIKAYHAREADEALKFLEENTFSVVLMDIQLPGISGFELTKIIQDRGYHIPIIAVTAHSFNGYREKCLTRGMDNYLSKPVIYEELEELLLKYCGDTIIDIPHLQSLYGGEIFRGLISSYLSSYEDDLLAMESAITSRNFSEIKRCAHRIKGTLGNFRVEEITGIFEEIERKTLNVERIEYLFKEGRKLIKIINYQLIEVIS